MKSDVYSKTQIHLRVSLMP